MDGEGCREGSTSPSREQAVPQSPRAQVWRVGRDSAWQVIGLGVVFLVLALPYFTPGGDRRPSIPAQASRGWLVCGYHGLSLPPISSSGHASQVHMCVFGVDVFAVNSSQYTRHCPSPSPLVCPQDIWVWEKRHGLDRYDSLPYSRNTGFGHGLKLYPDTCLGQCSSMPGPFMESSLTLAATSSSKRAFPRGLCPVWQVK